MNIRVKNICYADDDPDDHLIFSLAMTDCFPNVTTKTFDHCDELIKYLNSGSNPLPDIIFLNYNMPGNNGNECLRVLKKTAALMNIPVIIYSTSDYYRLQEESYRDGAFRYIVKGSDVNDVKDMLTRLIQEIEYGSGNQ